jgi:uncharacterized protein YhaN
MDADELGKLRRTREEEAEEEEEEEEEYDDLLQERREEKRREKKRRQREHKTAQRGREAGVLELSAWGQNQRPFHVAVDDSCSLMTTGLVQQGRRKKGLFG